MPKTVNRSKDPSELSDVAGEAPESLIATYQCIHLVKEELNLSRHFWYEHLDDRVKEEMIELGSTMYIGKEDFEDLIRLLKLYGQDEAFDRWDPGPDQ